MICDALFFCSLNFIFISFPFFFWRRANARNVRLYYPYRQYTNLFIIRFVIYAVLGLMVVKTDYLVYKGRSRAHRNNRICNASLTVKVLEIGLASVALWYTSDPTVNILPFQAKFSRNLPRNVLCDQPIRTCLMRDKLRDKLQETLQLGVTLLLMQLQQSRFLLAVAT